MHRHKRAAAFHVADKAACEREVTYAGCHQLSLTCVWVGPPPKPPKPQPCSGHGTVTPGKPPACSCDTVMWQL